MIKKYDMTHWTCVLGHPHILIYAFLKHGFPMLVTKRVFINKKVKEKYYKKFFPVGYKNKTKKFLTALYEEKIGIPEGIIEQYQRRRI